MLKFFGISQIGHIILRMIAVFVLIQKKLAYRYDSFQEALDVIADFSAGKDEKLMIVEVKE